MRALSLRALVSAYLARNGFSRTPLRWNCSRHCLGTGDVNKFGEKFVVRISEVIIVIVGGIEITGESGTMEERRKTLD